MDDLPWFYPDKVSVSPGDEVAIHASSAQSPCRLAIARVGLRETLVAEHDAIEIGDHPTPADADAAGCGWPVVLRFTVGDDWSTGYYDLALTAPGGESTHHFICVRKANDVPRAKAVLVLSTNTYFSYNYWGGANSYAHVEKIRTGELEPEQAREQAIGKLSRLRPFAQGMFAPPANAPRLVNLAPRGVNEFPMPGEIAWMQEHEPTAYDGSAGYLQKWEHRFAAWAEENGYDLDYLTDHDFEGEGSNELLTGYATVLLVGHSEYWSAAGRTALESFVDRGGHLAVFSGNNCYWKVRWEDEGDTLIAHKWKGESDDPKWANPETRHEATHLWSHPAFASPEAELFGLSFLYGGYHRLCMCVARGSSAFTVYDDEHWALEGTDLYYGDQFGGAVPLIGYENDGCLFRFGEDGLPVSDGGVGVPEDLEIIAIAPATIMESERSPFPPVIPPEHPEVLARVAFGSDGEKALKRLTRGHAVVASFRRGQGEVFNAGTTEWAHGLAAGDPFVEQITKNVLTRFGVG